MILALRPIRFTSTLLLVLGIVLWAMPHLAMADTDTAPQAGKLNAVNYDITDPNFGNMRVASISIPAGWKATSQVRWDFTSANYPVHVNVHVQSPDGKMWIDLLPLDAVYWMDRLWKPIPAGERFAGAVYAPNATIDQAMSQLVVKPARGRMPGFEITSRKPIDPTRLATAFGYPQLKGDAMMMHVRYKRDGALADEDFYSLYTATLPIPYTGPQGTTHEYHRMLVLSHSVGATDGLLPSVYPLLGAVVASIHNDEAYQRHIANVKRYITDQFNAQLKRGYDSIAAAGALSRSISANNDAMIASMDQQRAAQNRADAARRAAARSAPDTNDNFSQMIRGTTRMNDPYWGTSERDSNFSEHWTDGQGNYRSSNDPGFNPNVGAGGGATWQRMTPH